MIEDATDWHLRSLHGGKGKTSWQTNEHGGAPRSTQRIASPHATRHAARFNAPDRRARRALGAYAGSGEA
jgi:hypothetical protein